MSTRIAVLSGMRRMWRSVVSGVRWIHRQGGGSSGATKINYGT